jgi:hypothetical protein
MKAREVNSATMDAHLDKAKGFTSEALLDRQNANGVVRALIKAALADDSATTKTLTRELPPAVTAMLDSLASENELNDLPMEIDYVNDSANPTKDITTLIALTFDPQSIGLTKEVFVELTGN